MFIVLKRKKVALVLLALIVLQLSLTVFLCVKMFESADHSIIDFNVVIDAGHGGIDGGMVGYSGTVEAELNLEYAKSLGKLFANGGFNVIYTRKDSNGLYGAPTSGFKRRDMDKRREIINANHADLVISVHMNKYPQSSRKGPQLFFQKGRDDGKILADSIQTAFNKFTGNKHAALSGDFFVCRVTQCPAVIVECGFLSNPAEEQLLLTEKYREKVVETIYTGVMLYLYSLS